MTEIKFNTNEDILYQIAMIIYERHNSNIASINDHLGVMYSYQDLEDAKNHELKDEKYLLELAVKQLQEEKENLIKYLEEKIKEQKEYIKCLNYDELGYSDELKLDNYQDILERIMSGKYE